MTTETNDAFDHPHPQSQETPPLHLITLEPMPQQMSAGPDHDWTGISDPKRRKKLQDRIHQRIRRHRKKKMAQISNCEALVGLHSQITQPNTAMPIIPIIPNTGPDWIKLGYPGVSQQSFGLDLFTACEPGSERTERFIQNFTAVACQILAQGSPQLDMLLSLIQFNTTRALVINARLMGIASKFMLPEARSHVICNDINAPTFNSLPPSLHPTILQLTLNHHPWIDILPFPRIRDNLLMYVEDSYDKKELCRDLRGFLEAPNARGGMLVWGDSWDPESWEVTEAFLAKWPWVVRGCAELLASTNRWRAIRGEPALIVE